MQPGPSGARPAPNLRVTDAVAILVGIVIGVGIFRAPSLVAAGAASEAAFIALWLLGGVLSIVGARCYAELATAFPDAGGEYHFSRGAFGRSMASLFAWALRPHRDRLARAPRVHGSRVSSC